MSFPTRRWIVNSTLKIRHPLTMPRKGQIVKSPPCPALLFFYNKKWMMWLSFSAFFFASANLIRDNSNKTKTLWILNLIR